MAVPYLPKCPKFGMLNLHSLGKHLRVACGKPQDLQQIESII